MLLMKSGIINFEGKRGPYERFDLDKRNKDSA